MSRSIWSKLIFFFYVFHTLSLKRETFQLRKAKLEFIYFDWESPTKDLLTRRHHITKHRRYLLSISTSIVCVSGNISLSTYIPTYRYTKRLYHTSITHSIWLLNKTCLSFICNGMYTNFDIPIYNHGRVWTWSRSYLRNCNGDPEMSADVINFNLAKIIL